MFTRTFAAVTQAHLHDAWAGVTFGLAAAMVGAGLVLAWYTVSHLPVAAVAEQPASARSDAVVAAVSENDSRA